MAHPGGRPTKYKEEYCVRLIEFYDRPPTVVKHKTITLKSGTVIDEDYDAANKPVHVVDFCDEIGIMIPTFYRWIDMHPEFRDAYVQAKGYLERNITENALLNNYNAGFASLVSKNWLGWKDKTDVTSGDEKIEALQIYLPAKLEDDTKS